MNRHVGAKWTVIVTVLAVALSAAPASAEQFSATLSGFEEIGALAGPTGAILSTGQGTLDLTLDTKAQTLSYTLTYSDLSANVTQAHLHFAKQHVAGGIFVFLCTNLGNGPTGTPACPAGGGTVTGVLHASSVIAVPTQHVPAGSFDALVAILESLTAYANIHTTNFPAGEIRGQVQQGSGNGVGPNR